MENENASERQVDTTSDQHKTYDVSLPAQHLVSTCTCTYS